MFNEANTVENYIIHLLTGKTPVTGGPAVKETRTGYGKIGWEYVYGPALPRATGDVFIETYLREALLRLNPEIAAQPDRADEVLYKLRVILLSVQSEGLVRANELMAEWLRGDKSMPFGPNHDYVPIKLIDVDDLSRNDYVLANQVTFSAGRIERRFDLVLFANGIPVVVGEAKTPVRQAVTWFDGAHDIHHDYEENVSTFFAPNIFSFATEGKAYYYGAVRTPLEYWSVWRPEGETNSSLSYGGLKGVEGPLRSMLRPSVILDILQNLTQWATQKRDSKIKLIFRYQQ
jgi:type I restriction enzyme R subunit